MKVEQIGDATLYLGDCLESLCAMPSASVQTCVTSPPYWGLRDYGVEGQIGLEPTPELYVECIVEVFREIKRVLRDDGTLWVNLGDSYAASGKGGGDFCYSGDNPREDNPHRIPPAGLKPKDLVGIPWRVALALQADGWYLRSDIIWAKPNPMPESVTDRPTKAHEYVFLMAKSERYFYDNEAVKEEAVGKTLHDLTGPGYHAPGQAPNSGNRKALRTDTESRHRSQIQGGQSLQAFPDGKRNRRDVWTIPTKPFKGAHFAVMPEALVEPCILAGCPVGGTVLDPFTGSGTVGAVALRHGRKFIGTELNPAYAAMARKRMAAIPEPLPFEDAV